MGPHQISINATKFPAPVPHLPHNIQTRHVFYLFTIIEIVSLTNSLTSSNWHPTSTKMITQHIHRLLWP